MTRKERLELILGNLNARTLKMLVVLKCPKKH